LTLGTDASAAQLRAARGRSATGDRHGFRRHPEAVPRGQQHYAHKLTWRDVRSIRERYAAGGLTTRVLADEYGVRQSTVWEIVTGRSWREPPRPAHPGPPLSSKAPLRDYPHKLARSDVASIRERYAAGGVSMRALAAEYGVRQSTVWKILTGKSWPPSPLTPGSPASPPLPSPRMSLHDVVDVLPIGRSEQLGSTTLTLLSIERYVDGFVAQFQLLQEGTPSQDSARLRSPDLVCEATDDRGASYLPRRSARSRWTRPGFGQWRLAYQFAPALSPPSQALRLVVTVRELTTPGPTANAERGAARWMFVVPLFPPRT
jgi:hypothetical protein